MGLGISETENIGDDVDEMGDFLRTADLGGERLAEHSSRNRLGVWRPNHMRYVAPSRSALKE